MGALALGAVAAVAGIGLGAAGTSMAASSADKKRSELRKTLGMWLPDIDRYTDDYFDQLTNFSDEASALADTVGMSDLDRAMKMREKAMPGFTSATTDALTAIAPLLKGELPPAVMEAYMRSGAASSVGSGFGGSGFSAVNQGLFGARGSLGAMQTGLGLLPALMATLPNVNTPSTAAFLNSIMTPAQRVETQLNIRQQNIGISQALAGMQTSKDVWGGFLQQTGGQLFGGGMSLMGGGMGGGGMGGAGAAGGKATITSPNYITPL